MHTDFAMFVVRFSVCFLMLVAACGTLPNDPDPGDRRLGDLKKEPARELVMPGFRLVREEIRAKQLGEANNASDKGVGPSLRRQYERSEPMPLDRVSDWYRSELEGRDWRLGSTPTDEDPTKEVSRLYFKKIRNWCAFLTLRVSRTPNDLVFVDLRMSSSATSSPNEEENCKGRPTPTSGS